MQEIETIEQLKESLLSNPKAKVCAGSTKNALSKDADICVSRLSGILAYEPSEYTFTALAGTRLSDIESALAEHGQFMPFDPPMTGHGATLGGTVAAGLSGSGRFRYGGVRDFFLGVKLVSRGGRVIFGGGKVVKNAAGFDIPKLMVGSLGTFGVMTELTFKVFPRPKQFKTMSIRTESVSNAVTLLQKIGSQPLDLTCLDFDPMGRIFIRFGGFHEDSLEKRGERIRQMSNDTCEFLPSEDQFWVDANNFAWCDEASGLVKVPMIPSRIEAFEEFLNIEGIHAPRRYCVGGNLLWLGWPCDRPQDELISYCRRVSLRATVLTGQCKSPMINCDANRFQETLEQTFSSVQV